MKLNKLLNQKVDDGSPTPSFGQEDRHQDISLMNPSKSAEKLDKKINNKSQLEKTL